MKPRSPQYGWMAKRLANEWSSGSRCVYSIKRIKKLNLCHLYQTKTLHGDFICKLAMLCMTVPLKSEYSILPDTRAKIRVSGFWSKVQCLRLRVQGWSLGCQNSGFGLMTLNRKTVSLFWYNYIFKVYKRKQNMFAMNHENDRAE